MKILIADDELHIRKGLESLDWPSIGLKVCGTARNGQEAIEIAMKQHPDIILSDIRMPNVDGLEMTERFLQINPNCAIIFLSGYRDFTYARRALNLGVFDYLLKPADPEEILKCCSRAVDKINQTVRKNVAMVELENRVKELEIKEEITQEAPEQERKRGKVYEILEYIDQNFKEELSLQDLSEKFHFNSIYINRIIKKETGYTFLEILNNKRMNKAAEYLKNPDVKISEVAAMAGIPDQRYFSQIFKKYYGQSPRQYRKLIIKNQENV